MTSAGWPRQRKRQWTHRRHSRAHSRAGNRRVRPLPRSDSSTPFCWRTSSREKRKLLIRSIAMVMIIIMIIIIIVIPRAAPVQGAASCAHGCSKGQGAASCAHGCSKGGPEGKGGTHARAVCGMEGQPISRETGLDDRCRIDLGGEARGQKQDRCILARTALYQNRRGTATVADDVGATTNEVCASTARATRRALCEFGSALRASRGITTIGPLPWLCSRRSGHRRRWVNGRRELPQATTWRFQYNYLQRLRSDRFKRAKVASRIQ